jgi:hypothetical protein
VRVNKLSLDLERRGKILVACGANGSNQNGTPHRMKTAPLCCRSDVCLVLC